MTEGLTAYRADALFDGRELHKGIALLVRGGRVERLVPEPEIPTEARTESLGAGMLAPGYVDLQVNGGGGVMFNDDPSAETLATMAEAHARLGATTILPTLITDTPEKTREAIEAATQAVRHGVPGIAGLHLEGPHLSKQKKGAHDAALIREMGDEDLALLADAAARLPVLMVTLAPEIVPPARIRALVSAGAVVALGHTDAGFEICAEAVSAGARCMTHLFNAMSQVGSREPGAVGAALAIGELSAGLIADGFHVHDESMALALRAKRGPGRVFLVSDAMATAGSEIGSFALNGREVQRREGRLTLLDGTLAGADLDLTTAVGNVRRAAGLSAQEALAMATAIPAAVIGREDKCGHLRPGMAADFVHIDGAGRLGGAWRNGRRLVAPGGNVAAG